MNKIDQQLKSARPWLGPKRELIDREDMRADLLAMANRARTTAIRHWPFIRAELFMRHIADCDAFADDLAQRNAG